MYKFWGHESMILCNTKKIAVLALFLSAVFLNAGEAFAASRIKDIADFEGVRENSWSVMGWLSV